MRNKILSIMIVVILTIGLFPTLWVSADTSDPLIIDLSERASGDTIDIDDGQVVTIIGINTNNQINCGSNVTLTLSNATINNSENGDRAPIYFSGAGNTLILEGTSTLTAGSSRAGVEVPEGASLEIRGSGTLNVQGGLFAAGIGGGNQSSGGHIAIFSGAVIAQGGADGAGIGGGQYGSGGNITIYGGSVQATGGPLSNTLPALGSGAGIGGGTLGDGGTIHISGGTISARGGTWSSGIGGGDEGEGGNISISGGNVTAQGGSYSAGIGGTWQNSGGTINLLGGIIFASGSGADSVYDIGPGTSNHEGTVNISGTAKVFSRHDRVLEPQAETHTHVLVTEVEGGAVWGITLPSGWIPNFGAYIPDFTLTYQSNDGTDQEESTTQLFGTTTTIADATLFERTFYDFAGWFTESDGSGVEYIPGEPYTFENNLTLYATWTALPEFVEYQDECEEGESITLTPNILGGTWSFDESFLSRDGDVFTTLKSGQITVTYTVDGQSVSLELTITEIDEDITDPDDGDDQDQDITDSDNGNDEDTNIVDPDDDNDEDADTTDEESAIVLTLSSSVSDGTIKVGERITLTPNISGGTWSFDEDALDATFNTPATFTAKSAGTFTITYSVDGQTVSYDVVVREATVLATGESMSWIGLPFVVAGMAATAVVWLQFGAKSKKKNRV